MKRLIVPALLVLGLIGAWTALVHADPATLRPLSFAIDTGTKTAAATAGAATLNKASGTITSEALVTAAGGTYTLTLTDSAITATDLIFASVSYGTATTGSPAVTRIQPGAGSVVILIQNVHASAALNGTIKVNFIDLDL